LVAREQPREYKKILAAEQADAGTLPRGRRNLGVEQSVDVLEEIWHTANRELAEASRGRYGDLLRDIRTALVRMKEDAFGVCLCCRTTIGLRRRRLAPWTPLCTRCQEAAGRNDVEVLRSRSRCAGGAGTHYREMQRKKSETKGT
jgi:RNA polymerase-binding transcription factor DksA